MRFSLQHGAIVLFSMILAACASNNAKQQTQQELYLMPRSYEVQLQDNTPGSPVDMARIELHYVEVLGIEDFKVEKKINDQIRQMAGTQAPYNGSEDVIVTVKDAQVLAKKWLHFMVETYRMNHGAANGQTTVDSRYFDLATGNAVALNQVLKANYKEVLNPLVSQWLAGQTYQSDFQSITDNACFYQDSNTLYLCFSEYAIAPGAAGVVNVPIHKSQIKSLIIKGSLLD